MTDTVRRRAWVLGVGLLSLAGSYAAWRLGTGKGAGVVLPPQATRPLEPLAHFPAAAGALDDCNLLLVTLDTTRADRLGCYGNRNIRTPALDGLAARGVVFADATAVAPLTLPSHASLMTGLYPVRHGVRANGLFRLEEGFETLAERLRAQGFRTAAFVSALPLAAQFGLAQGFESYDDDLSVGKTPLPRHYLERDALQTTERARAWLGRTNGERFFLWVHYFDPHSDYAPPSPYAELYEENRYDGEIAFVDHALGGLLEELEKAGLAERTLVAVVGDHGEGLGQHSEPTHAYQTYDSTLRVPLILSAGERLGGGVLCTRPASQVDVAPMLLALLGCTPLEDCDGQDLLAPGGEDRPRFFESLCGTLDFGWEPLFGVYLGDLKYIHGSSPELFDRARDAAELENLVAREPATAERLREVLFEAFGDALTSMPTPTLRPSPEELAHLQGLGYLGGGGPAAAQASARIPPRVMMPILQRVDLAEDVANPPEQRIAMLREVLREHPDFYPAWKGLGNVYRGLENLEEAASALERCLELNPDAPQSVYELALVRASQTRDVEVLRLLEPIVAQYPTFVAARYLYGTVLGRRNRMPEAIVHLRAVFDLDPDYERCVEHMLVAYRLAGRQAELVELLQDHLVAHPDAQKVRHALNQ